jgi:hypothetical protein
VRRIEKRIVLIDGQQLLDPLIDYGAGVADVAVFSVKNAAISASHRSGRLGEQYLLTRQLTKLPVTACGRRGVVTERFRGSLLPGLDSRIDRERRVADVGEQWVVDDLEDLLMKRRHRQRGIAAQVNPGLEKGLQAVDLLDEPRLAARPQMELVPQLF